MSVLKSKGIIYKIVKYSEKSAICFVYTEDRGKLKLFLSDAFGKNRSILKLIPAEITYRYKDTTDLHKLFSIEYFTEFMFFHENPDLYLRLNLLFEIIDIVIHDDTNSMEIWHYITKINEKNFIKGVLYIIYYILVTFDILHQNGCIICGGDYNGTICPECFEITKDLDNIEILGCIKSGKEFKKCIVESDVNILKFFNRLIERDYGKGLKSLQAIVDLLG